MLRHFKTIILILLISIWSCESDSKLILEATESDRIVEVSLKDLTIPVDSSGLAIYRDDPTVFKDSLNQYLVYLYNRPQNSIDVYNFTAKLKEQVIQLSLEGPNAITRVYDKYIHGLNSIYVMSGGQLKLTDQKGRVLSSWNTQFDPIDPISKAGGYFHAPNEAHFKINSSSNELIGFYIHYNTVADVRNEDSMKEFILGKMNLKSGNLNFFPVSYSEIIQVNSGDYAEIKPNFSFIGDTLFYNWPIESNIYWYDIVNATGGKIGAKSRFSQNLSPTYSSNLEYNYRNEGTWFNGFYQYPEKPY